MQLVIAGAYYYDREDDKILIPHYTGDFRIVDCNEFIRMEELKARYEEEYIKGVKDYPIELNGEKYYDAEWGPFSVGNWELLSDLSELQHTEENFDWN